MIRNFDYHVLIIEKIIYHLLADHHTIVVGLLTLVSSSIERLSIYLKMSNKLAGCETEPTFSCK